METYFNRGGQPIGLEDWARLFEDEFYKRVKLDEINGTQVSTVWLGLNHNWGDGPPLIFETMIFGGPLDEECWRYSNEDDALIGHDFAVACVKAGVILPFHGNHA